ncbi:DUF2628 domain-containing protein [Agrobacterium rubi]|uniref:DUF2628 domain-containing protein n=1 Tax=Agrobacterium rubi TaxID=28099 RepID=UPI0015724CA2|nr:DUF2628 domain-containing protein [Agrobacterium rubi]NTF08594.1 DUF2628 domain-containing protein [Agrobacterium rubi]NTF20822.1 DUF2628 domain-containing protein [Agrobacterium rubi]NTF27721.1 DUF2628 domain-containing protein [Agrobacterium rubi]
MTSYLVLEAPGGPDRDHRSTRFIADRFSWLALLFPWVWFAIQRLWWVAIGIVVLQVAAGQVSGLEGFGVTGALFAISIGLIAGFEGRNIVVRHLVSKGWTLKDVVHARDLATAEEIYFSNLPEDDISQVSKIPQPDWKQDRKAGNGFMTNDPAGSFQFDLNGRR